MKDVQFILEQECYGLFLLLYRICMRGTSSFQLTVEELFTLFCHFFESILRCAWINVPTLMSYIHETKPPPMTQNLLLFTWLPNHSEHHSLHAQCTSAAPHTVMNHTFRFNSIFKMVELNCQCWTWTKTPNWIKTIGSFFMQSISQPGRNGVFCKET